MIKKVIASVCFAIVSVHASAMDLGLTPSHVYNIWYNVNEALLTIAEEKSNDKLWLDSLKRQRETVATAKKPGDVLGKVKVFSERLVDMQYQAGLSSNHSVREFEETKITPSDVFLNSGKVLDEVVLVLIKRTDKATMVNSYYKDYGFSGKVPSDCYALVELANWRLSQILAK